MRLLRKILLYTIGLAVILAVGLLIAVYMFKDRIIREFIREANKNIATPIKVGRIDVSPWSDFPRLDIVLKDVYVEDSHPGDYPLLIAAQVSFTLDPVGVWKGQYVINKLHIRESETTLLINAAGKNNYTIVKSGGGGGSVSFDLRNVVLENTRVTYKDLGVNQHHEFYSEAMTADILAAGDTYAIRAIGDVTTEQIGFGNSIYFREKAMIVAAKLLYDDLGKSLAIKPSTIDIDQATFEITGQYDFKDKPKIQLQAKSQQTTIHTLLSLFPSTSTERFAKFRSEGEVYFDMKLNGEISARKDPALEVNFGLNHTKVYLPHSGNQINNANLKGNFKTPTIAHLRQATLSLKEISLEMNGDSLTGNFEMKNFSDPVVFTDIHGECNAADLLNFYPMPELREVSGRIKADVSLHGRIALLKSKTTAQQVSTTGDIILKNLRFLYGQQKVTFDSLSGALQFNNNDLAISDVSGRFENSDFHLNGFFKNIVTYLLFEGQPIGIEADLKSRFLDVDQLFSIGFGNGEQGPYRFGISPQLHLNFKYDIDRMHYRRFKPRKVHGDLLVKGQMAVARQIDFNGMGGHVSLSGIVGAQNPKAIDLISTAVLKGIYIDSLFYVFENFQQDFIGYHHLKGQADANITMETTLDQGLHIFPETLIADVSTTIRNGQLNQFQPMQSLNKYLDDEGLANLRFAELQNDIHIEKKLILIPPMTIRSNVTTLQLAGKHSFDQQIDYRVVAPLRNKRKIDPDEAFGAIEEDLKGQSKVFLKIVGTTDKFEVLYDKDAVRKKIGNDIKKEVLELRDILLLRGKKKKKEAELEKDDYFDWDKPKP